MASNVQTSKVLANRGYLKIHRICPYTGVSTLWKSYSRRGDLATLKTHVETTYELGTYTELVVYPTRDNVPQVWVLNQSYATYGQPLVWKLAPRR